MADNSYISKNSGDIDLSTIDKSLIEINSTSYNIYDNWFDFVRKYFGIDNLGNPYINTLKSSFFGYFNEIASSEIKNAVYHRNFLYDEHFLNTAVLPESIYNFAKMYNVPIENAYPATMYISLSFSEKELVNSALLREENEREQLVTNETASTLKIYTLVLDRETTFTVGTYDFLLPYPIVITIQEISEDSEGNKEYSFNANYDFTANTFPPLENEGMRPYLKVWRESVDGNEVLFIGCQIYQLNKKSNSIVITTTSENPESIYHNVSYDDQISYFEAFYEYRGKTIPLNLYFNNIYTPSSEEYYGYYNYLNDSTIQISFSPNLNAFRPVTGSTLIINTYTTKGYDGNFNYAGNVTINTIKNKTFRMLSIGCSTNRNGSANGKDKLDTFGMKTKILEAKTTRNNIITDNDLKKFFDSINQSLNINGSSILFLKKQDDVIKRLYCNFLLLRDENRRVIPTNTAPHIKFKLEDFAIPDTTQAIIKEHSIVECNYIRDINAEYTTDMKDYININTGARISQDYIQYKINNSYFKNYIDKYVEENGIDWEYLSFIDRVTQLEVASDALVYTIPFMIAIQTEPFLKATYYNMDINQEYLMEYQYLNNKVGSQFSISTLTIEKSVSPTADNNYTLDSNVYKLSFNLNTNLSYSELKENVVIKCNVYNRNNDKELFGHFFFKLANVSSDTSSGLVNYDYKYEATLSTDYKFDKGNLNLYNSLYKTTFGKGFKPFQLTNAFVSEDLTFEIGILYFNKDLSNSQTDKEKGNFVGGLPENYFEGLFTSLFKQDIDLTSISQSLELTRPENVFVCSDDPNESSFFIKDYQTKEGFWTNPRALMVIPANWADDKVYNWYYDKVFENKNIFYQMIQVNESLSYNKLTIRFRDEIGDDNPDNINISFSGYVKLYIENAVVDNTPHNWEIVYKISFDDSNINSLSNRVISDTGERFIDITINDLSKNIDGIYQITPHEQKVTVENHPTGNNDTHTIVYYDRNDADNVFKYNGSENIVDLITELFAIDSIGKVDSIHLIIDDYKRRKNGSVTNEMTLTIDSVFIQPNDREIKELNNDHYNIENYVLATTIKNSESINLFKNMSKLMDSILTYDEKTDTYDLELVPLIGLRYYIARPNTVYDLVNQFIQIVDGNLPKLEENTYCDLKFYNSYGPSRYFYLNKEIIETNIYIDKDTNEQVKEEDIDKNNPYNYYVSSSSVSQYNYLGRTDIILDFNIYVNDTITSEKDMEIKKFISDYIEYTNESLILAISNLIGLLQNRFPIIRYIKYNGVFPDILDTNDTSKNNDYQVINNDFNFNDMTKEEIRVYVPEYLNLKKDVVRLNDSFGDDISLNKLYYSTYDYIININYKL